MQLVFVIYSMQAGGAERVLSIMANYWSARSQPVTVITLDDGSKPSFYDINSDVRQVSLDVAGVSKSWPVSIMNNLKRIYKLRRAIREAKSDAVISFMTETNVLTLISTLGLNIPVIATEHTDPWTGPVAGAWSKLRSWLYPRASRVVVLNQRAREFFDAQTNIQTTVMPNPVVIELGENQIDPMNEVSGNHLIVAMGRLSPEKCFDLLIQAYSKVASRYSKWNLMILGEGPERGALEKLRGQLGLNDRVILPGTVKYPHTVLEKCEIFVSSSELEGFPMAICEALACGLPVIAAEYHSAIRDIIQHEQNGILVPIGDHESLAAAMNRLIDAPEERKHLAKNAVQTGVHFGVDAVMQRWDELLAKVAA